MGPMEILTVVLPIVGLVIVLLIIFGSCVKIVPQSGLRHHPAGRVLRRVERGPEI